MRKEAAGDDFLCLEMFLLLLKLSREKKVFDTQIDKRKTSFFTVALISIFFLRLFVNLIKNRPQTCRGVRRP